MWRDALEDGEGKLVDREGSDPPTQPPAIAVRESQPLLIAGEKNLEEIGYFSASSSTGPQALEKTVTWNRERDGKQMMIEVTILGRQFGLPNTWDLDLYRAWQYIIWSRYIRQDKPIPDPIPFTSPDLLLHARKEYGGKQGDAVYKWLQKMMLTGIASKGAVFDAGKGNWITTRTPKRKVAHKPERDLLFTLTVFRQVHQEGHAVQDFRASTNEVYLQDWYRANLERSFTKPVDVDLHFSLKRSLSKVLLAVLDVMLYAGSGRAAKRYDDLCTLLGVPLRTHLSLIRQQLDPSLTELQQLGYLSGWHYRRSKDEMTWIVSWEAGPRWQTTSKIGSTAKPYVPKIEESGQLKLPFGNSTKEGSSENAGVGKEDSEARNLVRHFRTVLKHKHVEPSPKEFKQAKGLIEEHGPEVCRHLIEYAITEMKKTNYRARWFGAVLDYVVEGLAEYSAKQKDTAQAMVQKAQEAAAESSKSQAAIEKTQRISDAIAQLSPEQLRDLHACAEEVLRTNPFNKPSGPEAAEAAVQARMRLIMAERLGLR